jgi:adenylate cyclase
MPTVCYMPDTRDVEAALGEPLLRAALRAGVPHAHACGGNARCSTCRVQVLEGLDHCAARNEREQALAERLHFGPELRLACQTTVTDAVRLRRLVVDADDIQLCERMATSTPQPVGEERRVAVLFADIRGFTAFAEALTPYDVIYFLNRYFDVVGCVIAAQGGSVDNLIGDGVMALFRDNRETAPLQAVRAGLGMLAAVERLQPYVNSVYGRSLRIGVGVHYGDVVLGGLGSVGSCGQRITAIGDTVNFASRIEAATRELQADFLISDATYERVRDQVRVGRTFEHAIRGKTGAHRLHEVLGLR